MAQRPVGCQPQKLFGVAEITGRRQGTGGQNRGFAGVPQRTAKQLRYAAAGCAECGLTIGIGVDVKDARRHFQKKKAQEAFCFSQPVQQVSRHIRQSASILQQCYTVDERSATERRKHERFARFSSQLGKSLRAGERQRKERRPHLSGKIFVVRLL